MRAGMCVFWWLFFPRGSVYLSVWQRVWCGVHPFMCVQRSAAGVAAGLGSHILPSSFLRALYSQPIVKRAVRECVVSFARL